MYVKEGRRLAIRLDKDLEKELDLLAKARGSNRSVVIGEAINQYLADNEDLRLTKEPLSAMAEATPLKQLRKEFGLDR